MTGTQRCAFTLLIYLLCFGALSGSETEQARARIEASLRQEFLHMFARSYFPGRAGQIMLVPSEGNFITSPEPAYRFMHGSPWDYDVKIPLLFYGPSHIRKGTYKESASQQDVAPTLGALLGVSLPSATGRILRSALKSSQAPLRGIFLAVLDGAGEDYFERYASRMPVLSRLRREGAWFARARVNVLPSVTAVTHATISTGTDPRIHGIAANSGYDRVSGKRADPFPELSPANLMALTLADVWNAATEGRAVIIAQASVGYAAVALGGHGACMLNGRPIILASYDSTTGGWQTNPQCYRLPEYLREKNSSQLALGDGGQWLGHDVAGAGPVRRSAWFSRFEADALVALIENEPFGEDGVADLIVANFKTPDFVGHAFGPDSQEVQETLAELDRQLGRVIGAMEKKTGPEGYVVAVTADHGMPPDPEARGKRRVFLNEVAELIHRQFDPQGAGLVVYYDASSNQLFLDTGRVRELGLTLAQIARYLEAQSFIFAAYTEEEVRKAVLR